MPDRKSKIKEKTTDYTKIAKALGDILSKGIKVSLVDINKSNLSFEPDVENAQILFGMKALAGLNSAVIEQIIEHRPYKSLKDFMVRCPLTKTAMISLIKAGAFDNLESKTAESIKKHPRYYVMAYYLSQTCDAKSRLTLQNFNGLLQRGLIPEELERQKQVFILNKQLKANKCGQYYIVNNNEYNLIQALEMDNDHFEIINGILCILQSAWDKIYKVEMDDAREYLKAHQKEMLDEFNFLLFKEAWDKYATGNLSSWEMNSMCFYYNEHELANVDIFKYGIVNFNDLSETPDVDYFFKRNGKEIPIFNIRRIIGTVIAKDAVRSSVTLLTLDGVVNVKFTKEYFAMFNRQISELNEAGVKKVKEKSWFTRGTKIMVAGFRRDDTFVAKTYKNTPGHQLYKIEAIEDNGEIIITHDRYQVEEF